MASIPCFSRETGVEPNPTLFPQLLPHIPPMVASLLKEDSNSGTSCLEQLAELVHCMVFRFPGFPDLYEPVMEAVKVSDNAPLRPRSTLTSVNLGLAQGLTTGWWQPPSFVPGCLLSPTPQPILCLRHTLSPLLFPRWISLSPDGSEPFYMPFSVTVSPSWFCLDSSYISFKALLKCSPPSGSLP